MGAFALAQDVGVLVERVHLERRIGRQGAVGRAVDPPHVEAWHLRHSIAVSAAERSFCNRRYPNVSWIARAEKRTQTQGKAAGKASSATSREKAIRKMAAIRLLVR